METVTTAIVAALASGSTFVLKESAKEAVKDGYDKLKRLIERRCPDVNIEQLTSKSDQDVLADTLERQGAGADLELITQARVVADLIRNEPLETLRSIGIDIDALDKANATFNTVHAGRGSTGVRIGQVVGGNLRFGPVSASAEIDPPKKS